MNSLSMRERMRDISGKFRWQPGVRQEVASLLLALVLPSVLAATLMLGSFFQHQQLRQQQKNLVAVADSVSRILSAKLSADSLDRNAMEGTLKTLLEPWGDIAVLRHWRYETGNRKILSADRRESFGSVLTGMVPESRLRYNPWPLRFGLSTEVELVVAVPLLHGGVPAQRLLLTFSLASTAKELAALQRTLFILAALYGLAVMGILYLVLGKRIVRPLRALQTRLVDVSRAGGAPLHLDGPREIADLARSFNDMIKALAASEERLRANLQSLERSNAELRQAREELIRSERLSAVGHLAAGMAHEIGNPLGAVIGYLDVLSSERLPESSHGMVEAALKECARIDRLVRELLEFARPEADADLQCRLSDVVGEALDFLGNQGALKGIELSVDCRDDTPVRGSFHRLLQVAVNLLLNARDACEDRGRIEVRTGRREKEAFFEIRDSGSGIDPDQRKHIFDPFFTTKQPGRGWGLGLSICHRIVDQYGGRIEVESAVGQGSRFRVFLPAAADEGVE
ncbi:signal transduction histidine kinase [Geothermobacter ehrlichii]|uniref:histidine kinase n=1 Tax=Geothermobacter ehrlichii TaxID=213224 RepID=A0A5D3WMY2_9BACT|nr:HAMP domain-containing sensor histidine kinase [Geothermobacter ehrlichii]TYO99927.1 signal transduction histidine kinase [Geothermobacter ehrlichii]